MQTDIRKLAKQVARKGRKGDMGLVHMTPKEITALQAMGATTNPETGLPEASFLSDTVKSVFNPQQAIGSALGLGIGGAGGATGGQVGGNVLSGKPAGENLTGAATADVLGLGAGAGIAGSGLAASAAPAAPSALSANGAEALGAGGAGEWAGTEAAEEAANVAALEAGDIPPATTADTATAGNAAAPASTAPGAAPAAAQEGFLGKNAVPLSLLGGVALLNSRPKPTPADIGAQRGISAEAQSVAKQLTEQYKSGQLSAPQQGALDQQVQNAKNQVNSYFASIGQSDSTSHMQALAQVEQQSLAQKQNMLNTALQQGMQAIGVASGPLNTAIQYQLGQDKMLNDALSSFGTAVGTLYGRQAGAKAA